MILEEKKLKEIKNRVQQYIQEGIIKTKNPKEHIGFFLRNSEDSINSALCLYDISTNKEYQEHIGYPNLRGFLWVINASYYSMFYNVRALLEHEGIKIKSDLSIHARTFDAFVHFFYITGKLKKVLFEYYSQAQEEAAELLGQQKADELVQNTFLKKGNEQHSPTKQANTQYKAKPKQA